MAEGQIPDRCLSRRRFLGGLAGAAGAALLAACGGSAATGTAPAGGGGGGAAAPTNTVAPTTAPTTAPAAATPTAGGAATRAATGAASPATTAAAAFPSPTALRPSGAVTLEFWFGEPPESGPQDLANAFMQRYPGIKVNATRYVNDDTGNTKLDTALQGGTPIDVYMSYGIPRLGQRIRAGAAEELTPYIAADPAVKAWAEGTEGLFKHEGKFFSLPTVRDPYGVIVNKTLLDKAGVKLPERWTIDEFRTLAKQLSGRDVYGCYAPPDVARIILGPDYRYKSGGKESNFDHPAFRQAIELHRAMIEEKSAFPWTEVLAQNLRVYQQNVFLGGQAVFWPGSQFVLRYVNDLEKYPHEFVTTFAPMPAPAGVDKPFNPGSISNDVLLNPKAKDKAAAWAFLRFRLTEGAPYMLKSGKAPAFPGADPAAVEDGILGPKKGQLYDVAAYRRVYVEPTYKLVTDTITTAGAAIDQLVTQQTDRCLIGEITVDQWVTTVKQQADAAIKQAGG
jgi:multiple sugar transport system substrate-binding protein